MPAALLLVCRKLFAFGHAKAVCLVEIGQFMHALENVSKITLSCLGCKCFAKLSCCEVNLLFGVCVKREITGIDD
uniref:Putative secreted protein n=1 Tax=Anopheles darlingi TaxID=43151 RepID=A0A2M4D1B3_ANODA